MFFCKYDLRACFRNSETDFFIQHLLNEIILEMFRRLEFIIGQRFGTSYTVVLAQDLISCWIQARLGTTSLPTDVIF